ncbi:hypothetical protein LMG28138_01649 [Pararobbsia alpina]|uniref:Uncharacterized protein n=2 Tax=Pararobbsia alpina TaxID=621374 RepID=A0A6S7B0X4_9BURK|nr:hypothetical protein LMG28138_01649 [Pararobbsia alpina]
MALYPLMTAIGLNLLASLVATSRPPVPPVTQTTGKDSVWRRVFQKVFKIWFALAPLGALIVISVMSDPVKWVFLLGVMFPWINWFAETPLVVQFIPSQSRQKVVYWLIALPILAIQLGSSHAQAYFDGTETRTVAPTGAAKDLQWDKQHPIGYLGFAGGTHFLFESKTGNLIMINQAVAEPLSLQEKPLPTMVEWVRGILHLKP